MTVALSVAAFGGGAWLLVESVESLVKALTAWALAAGLSGLALSALVLGFDLESTGAGIAASLDGLPGTAIGTSIGAGIFLITVGLGLAAIVAPFEVRTPPVMLGAVGLATILPLGLLWDGSLSRADGAFLLLAFVPLVGAVALSLRRGRQVPEPSARRPRRLWLRLAAAVAGLVIGAEVLVLGTRGIVDGLGLSETLFGFLAVAAAVSFEEVVLEMLPAHRGHPEISVGNALGTLLFLLTASLGVVALVQPVAVPEPVLRYHAPALAVAVVLLGALLARGRLGRPEGTLLVSLYAVYVAGALVA